MGKEGVVGGDYRWCTSGWWDHLCKDTGWKRGQKPEKIIFPGYSCRVSIIHVNKGKHIRTYIHTPTNRHS